MDLQSISVLYGPLVEIDEAKTADRQSDRVLQVQRNALIRKDGDREGRDELNPAGGSNRCWCIN